MRPVNYTKKLPLFNIIPTTKPAKSEEYLFKPRRRTIRNHRNHASFNRRLEGKNFSPLTFLFLLPLWMLGCQPTPSVLIPVLEGSTGGIYLQSVSQQDFQATHPISLSRPTLYNVLSGVHIRTQQQLFQKLLSGPSPQIPIFTGTSLTFLADGVQTALEKATSNEIINFKLYEGAHGVHDTLEGTIFHHDAHLYITFTKLPETLQAPSSPSRTKRQLTDINHLQNIEFTFIPEQAQQSPSHPVSFPNGTSKNTLIIRYAALSKTKSPPSSTTQHSSQDPNQQVPPTAGKKPSTNTDAKSSESLQGVVRQQQQEIHDLRQELHRIQQDLQNLPRPSSP